MVQRSFQAESLLAVFSCPFLMLLSSHVDITTVVNQMLLMGSVLYPSNVF